MSHSIKPLGQRAYGHIPHLPNSRMGASDHHVSPGQANICTIKARDRHDKIIVQEKVDGSCVAVANVNGKIIPLIRAGYEAISARYEQHRLFADWVFRNLDKFEFLTEGYRVVGEWLAQAHSTRYVLTHDPFVAFDIMDGTHRMPYEEFALKIASNLIIPRLIHIGGPLSIEKMLEVLEPSGHGAIDPVEGAVWRVERKGEVDFLTKYVRPDKIDGIYLPEMSGKEAIWNWRPQN